MENCLDPAEPELDFAWTSEQKLPNLFVPISTAKVRVRSVEEYHVYSDARVIDMDSPIQTDGLRRRTLNALRTIVPAAAQIRISSNIVVDVILYDFYYESNTLRALLLLPQTLQLFEAEHLVQSLLHIVKTKPELILHAEHFQSRKQDKHKAFQVWNWIFINTNGSGKVALTNIPCGIRRLTFNNKQYSGFLSNTAGILRAAAVHCPEAYVPFPTDYNQDINSKPSTLCGEDPNGKCLSETIWNATCVCQLLPSKERKELAGFLPFLSSTLNEEDVVWRMRIGFEELAKQLYSVPTNTPQPITTGLKCFFSQECKANLDVFWQCCPAPISCFLHAEAYNRKHSVCPIHKIKKRCARFLPELV